MLRCPRPRPRGLYFAPRVAPRTNPLRAAQQIFILILRKISNHLGLFNQFIHSFESHNIIKPV